MEIRRKVFSLLQDENGEERYYSTNEFEISYDEETGEKMFSEKEDKGMSTGAKVALGVAGTAAATVAALEGGHALKKVITKANVEKLANLNEEGKKALKQAIAKKKGITGTAAAKEVEAMVSEAKEKLAAGYKGEGLKIVDKAHEGVKSGVEYVKNAPERYRNWKRNKINDAILKRQAKAQGDAAEEAFLSPEYKPRDNQGHFIKKNANA